MKQCEGLGKDALIRKSSTIMDSGERGERNLFLCPFPIVVIEK